MPAATGPKRVKGKRIERPFIIGSEAWPLDDTNRKPDTPADHTKGWRVYVRVPEGQPDISRWLKKVQFRIFHTYMNPNRTVENPPFEINETGWGGFAIDIRLHFVSEAGLKSESRHHFLQLEPYGDEELQAQQNAEKLVRSEFLEYVEFNEPSEALFDTLTDDSQFGTSGMSKKGAGAAAAAAAAASGAKGRGGAKGAGKANMKDDNSNSKGTVELPEQGTAKDPFSKEMEQRLLDMLVKAEQEVEKLLEEEKQKEEQVAEELKALRAPPPPQDEKAKNPSEQEKPASTAKSNAEGGANVDVDMDAEGDVEVHTEMAQRDKVGKGTTVKDAEASANKGERDEAGGKDDNQDDGEEEDDDDDDDDGEDEEEGEEEEEAEERDDDDEAEEEEDDDDADDDDDDGDNDEERRRVGGAAQEDEEDTTMIDAP